MTDMGLDAAGGRPGGGGASDRGDAEAATAGSSRAAAAALVVAMGVGSLVLWIGLPLGWLWLAGRLSEDYPTIYLIALAAAPLSMVLFGWGLYRLNRVYMRVSGAPVPSAGRQRSAWMRSMRDDRNLRAPKNVLDTFMAISVAIAFVLFLIWFFFFAGSSLPLSGAE